MPLLRAGQGPQHSVGGHEGVLGTDHTTEKVLTKEVFTQKCTIIDNRRF